MDYTSIIKENLNNCLTTTNLEIGQKKVGKVRDTYDLGDKMAIITTDRQSAFDRILASVPFKGQVLNQTSAWWFKKTTHIVPNHILEIPDPNVMIVKKCQVFPIEFVVRGYITGTTDTSAWVNYQKGVRNFCGNILPENIKKNQKFNVPIITPTTKSDDHDCLISAEEIVSEGLMTKKDWDYVSLKTLELFRFGQAEALKNGLILVDTKYEFGKDENGNILLLDEIHTPDSSRYWIAKTYEERFLNGMEPENIDKEFLRLWFKEHCDPYNDPELPPAPRELVIELSRRYIMLYEMITGEKFIFPKNKDINSRITTNLRQEFSHPTFVTDRGPESDRKQVLSMLKVIIIMGSTSDEEHAQKIINKLNEHKICSEKYIASAHKEPKKVLEILEKNKTEKVIYITIAGRSNALSGFVAANSNSPTIACPPFADKMDMLVNINSTLQMPSNVPVLTILDPENCALAVKRIYEFYEQSN